ncbi:hypothetical protein HanOQP8_Chr12g0445481 [Helianthus annuus]|nr:hypothetical protein HanOQP8_Chr12g0445481 [Helianthus annuus]
MQRLMMAEKPQTTRGRCDTVRVPPNPMVAGMWRLRSYTGDTSGRRISDEHLPLHLKNLPHLQTPNPHP